MKVKFSSYQATIVTSSLWAGLLLIALACRLSAELPVSDLSASPSPGLTEVITATPTSTLMSASFPIPTSTVVSVQQPTSSPTPTEVVMFPPPPTITRMAKAEVDAAHLEQIMSGSVGYIRLWPKVADLMLTDAQGRRLGYDPTSGQDVNDFFDAETNFSNYFRYEGTEGNYNNIITLLPLQAWSTTITITLTGLEAGEYTLLAIFSDGKNFDVMPMYGYTGTIRPGEIQTKTIDVPQPP